MGALLIGLLSSMFGENGPLGQYFKIKAQQVQASAELALKVEQDKLAMSSIMAQAAVDSERNKLAATSQTFKAISFFLLNVPIIITCLSSGHGAALWANMNMIPVWYAQLYVAVVFVIWGLPVVGNATSTIFSAVQDAWDAKNQRKLNVIQANGDAQSLNLGQAKKQIFDIMKQTTNLQGYTQVQVDAITKVLDPILKQGSN